MSYRQIWIKNFGPIPKDEEGFSYEIHHIDGNHDNHDLNNLKLVTIREHLEIHLKQEDWFAAALIAKRLGLGPKYSSELQTGKKRPGIGGAKKGNIPWNKNKKNCFNAETIEKMSAARQGKRHNCKLKDEQCKEIISLYKEKPDLPEAGTKSKNGKIISYETAFAKKYHSKYGVSDKQLINVIKGKRNVL